VSDVLKTLAAVLLWHDPMGLARYQQADEYQGEAELLYHHRPKPGRTLTLFWYSGGSIRFSSNSLTR
jgi:hypothetical protein